GPRLPGWPSGRPRRPFGPPPSSRPAPRAACRRTPASSLLLQSHRSRSDFCDAAVASTVAVVDFWGYTNVLMFTFPTGDCRATAVESSVSVATWPNDSVIPWGVSLNADPNPGGPASRLIALSVLDRLIRGPNFGAPRASLRFPLSIASTLCWPGSSPANRVT